MNNYFIKSFFLWSVIMLAVSYSKAEQLCFDNCTLWYDTDGNVIKSEKKPKLIADTDEIVRFELISCVDTILHRNIPDCQDIRYGFEGGRVVKVGNTYHWITAEMVGDPLWVNMRLGHWTSFNGIDWQRQSTICSSDGDYTGTSQRASVFGPMTVFVEEDNRWHLVYVCYKAKPNEPNIFWCNYDGIIQHAVSKTEGIDGIGGPYEDKNVLMRYNDHPDSWEGLQGTDSFFPYKIGNKWYALYGSATTQDLANCQWLTGLAQADRIEGPWKRISKYNPVNLNGFAENPIVMQLENGVYIAIVDGGHGENKLGYTLSWDGINWSMLRYFKIEPAVKRWWSATRTPLSLIKENDGTYTLFFTAFKPDKNGRFGALSKLTFKVSFL
ncbi:hypothetical protein EZS27_009792 [termite gut metagenome]|uniref:Glycosyl hydrolase family 32 N-terminal domain-containing protein n=1 Tax=termite gut metagenome TaxID=433724 RepID=A0A5J4S9R0_9ZZZZ